MKKIETKNKLRLNEVSEITFESVTTAGAAFEFTGADNKMVFLFDGTGTVTIQAGNGLQGVTDVTTENITQKGAITIDSGAFKHVTGEYKDHVLIKPSATMNVALVQLP